MGRSSLSILSMLALASLLCAGPVHAQPPYQEGPYPEGSYTEGPYFEPVPEEMIPEGYSDYEFGGTDEYWPEEGWPAGAAGMDFYQGEVHSGCDVCAPYPCGCHGVWSFNASPMVMQRQKSRNTLISFIVTPVTVQGVTAITRLDQLTTQKPRFGIEPGMQVGAERYLGSDLGERDYFFEFVYFGLFDWDASSQVAGGRLADPTNNLITRGSLFSPFDLEAQVLPLFDPGGTIGGALFGGFWPAFDSADVQRIFYSSTLHNFEWNMRIRPKLRRERRIFNPARGWTYQRGVGWSQTWIGGLRFLNIDEDFDFLSVAQIETAGADTGVNWGSYEVKTRNRLLGLQLGTELTSRHSRFEWGVSGKFGGYVNFGESLTRILSNDAADPRGVNIPAILANDSESRAAFVGEAGLFGVYRIAPAWAFRGGIQVMWVEGLALAPEQLDFTLTEPYTIKQRGGIFYQGATIGLEGSF